MFHHILCLSLIYLLGKKALLSSSNQNDSHFLNYINKCNYNWFILNMLLIFYICCKYFQFVFGLQWSLIMFSLLLAFLPFWNWRTADVPIIMPNIQYIHILLHIIKKQALNRYNFNLNATTEMWHKPSFCKAERLKIFEVV